MFTKYEYELCFIMLKVILNCIIFLYTSPLHIPKDTIYDTRFLAVYSVFFINNVAVFLSSDTSIISLTRYHLQLCASLMNSFRNTHQRDSFECSLAQSLKIWTRKWKTHATSYERYYSLGEQFQQQKNVFFIFSYT